MDHNQLRDYIQNFSLDSCPLGNQGYNRVLLQLFGYTGHGKTALINSLIYVLNNGKFIKHAETENKYDCGSVTLERRAYELTPTITVVDNRPVIMGNSRLGTVYAQLGIFPIVVLTFKTTRNYIEDEKIFRSMGAEVVVAVENYSVEDQIQTRGRNTDFLTLLKSALDDVTFRMGQSRDPKEERRERKKFLLKCVHDFETRRVREFQIERKSEAKNTP